LQKAHRYVTLKRGSLAEAVYHLLALFWSPIVVLCSKFLWLKGHKVPLSFNSKSWSASQMQINQPCTRRICISTGTATD